VHRDVWLKEWLLYVGGKWGTIATHGLHKTAVAISPDDWHTTIAASVATKFLPSSLSGAYHSGAKY
jgi:hypothetical protein